MKISSPKQWNNSSSQIGTHDGENTLLGVLREIDYSTFTVALNWKNGGPHQCYYYIIGFTEAQKEGVGRVHTLWECENTS